MQRSSSASISLVVDFGRYWSSAIKPVKYSASAAEPNAMRR